MIQITLPDGSVRSYKEPVTGVQLAGEISSSLKKAAVAVKVNGQVWDLTRPVDRDASIKIITRTSPEGLEILRHDAAHVFAQAIKELYPETQITIGPAIENGFYYDLYRKTSLSQEDFPKIEARMREIVDRDIPFVRHVWPRDKAIEYFKSIGEHFKAELIENIPGEEEVSVYEQGEFLDLCRGPHLPSTGALGKHFKLMKIAGAYWRGDPKNPQLQRVYGTCWESAEALESYIKQLEEAEKRDHRKLGAQMALFHMQEEARGSIFWHPNGWKIYRTLQDYIRRKIARHDYQEVHTPAMMDRSLWEASGHWEKFGENMFCVEHEDQTLALKPMNCPGHVQIFKQGIKSYRDLPLRLAEFGSCYRNEPSGALHGIMRTRAFVQDDAHIFCTPDQIVSETKAFSELLKEVYADFGFTDVRVKFSDRPEKRAGSDESWDKAEAALREAALAAGLEMTENRGEGAFYGPKLEFVLKDAIGREWQLGTFQVDFCLPERLGALYVGEDGQKHCAVMLHRAIFGSLERFIGVLIEHTAGHLPLWLAPIQVCVLSISQESQDFGEKVAQLLKEKEIRVDTDFGAEKISYKIRQHSLEKVPILVIVGKKEAEEERVTLRFLGIQEQETLALSAALDKITQLAKRPQ